MTTATQRTISAERLRRALQEGAAASERLGRPVLVSVSVERADLDAIELFARAGAESRMLWEQPNRGAALVGMGEAARLTASGPERFEQISSAWRELLAGAVIDGNDATPVPAPVCMGGFAFDPRPAEDSDWDAYPAALLVVPKYLFGQRDGRSWLTVSMVAGAGMDAASRAEEMAAELAGLGGPVVKRDGAPNEVDVPENGGERAAWERIVAEVIGDVQRHALDKLVVARRVRVEARSPIEPASVLRRLREGYSGCTLFAVGQGDRCFLGATPERLVRLNGPEVMVDCLAGTAPRGTTDEDDRERGKALLEDAKERHEHALVVGALKDGLTPLCSELNVPATPDLRRMANVQHLYTPVQGTLEEERHVLDLVARLHPTPASGGLPRDAALALLGRYEDFSRGWYAGPVGWVDGKGGGEFSVAIRSALVRGREALLYAGCGIVGGSDPAAEYEESRLKLRPMLWAINGTKS